MTNAEIVGPLGRTLRTAVAARIASAGDEEAGLDVSPQRAWEALADADADVARFAGRVAQTAALLGLDALAADVLWLCAAPELDNRYGQVFAFLQDEATSRRPTPRLIASVLAAKGVDDGAVFACLAVDGPLRRRGCVRLPGSDAERPLADQPICLAPELADFLLDSALQAPVLDGRVLRADLPAHPVGRDEAVDRIRAALASPGVAPVLVAGADATAVLAVALGHGLALVDARAAGAPDILPRAALIAALEGRAVVFDRAELLDTEDRSRLEAIIESEGGHVLLCAATATAIAKNASLGAIGIEVEMPSLPERRATWGALARGVETEEVAAKFRLTTAQIARAVDVAQVEARLAGLDAPGKAELDAGARQASSSGLGERALRVAPGGSWDDLVLPERQLELLKSISSYLRHRDRVLADWGYQRAVPGRQGLAVLFAGEPGTGKTMAARVLAADLGLDLYSVDLASVVSKYIGETEKNLDQIFAAADGSNAILFFDEADALFGRRSEVGDSSDRYANIEVAYLLQRMEAHAGAVILATNLMQNIDDAFRRRLDFSIDFRFPEAADRRRIWTLVIPSEAPVADDLDLDFLSERFKLSGGSIRNCSLAAAFEAATAGQPVRMAHLVRAVAAEYGKLGRLTVEADFGPYGAMLHDADAPKERPAAPPVPEPPPLRRESVRIGSRIDEL